MATVGSVFSWGSLSREGTARHDELRGEFVSGLAVADGKALVVKDARGVEWLTHEPVSAPLFCSSPPAVPSPAYVLHGVLSFASMPLLLVSLFA
jgi:hypothetical protein